MKKFILLLAVTFFSLGAVVAAPPTLGLANRLYASGDYRGAAAAYERVLATHYNADAYYNLGNAYYRLGDMPRAILNYERAYLLNPMSSDVRFNLALARSKASVAASTGQGSSFVADVVHSAAYMLSTTGWNVLALAAFALAVVAFLVFYFGRSLRARQVSFWLMCILLFVTIAGQAARVYQHYNLTHRRAAIVLKAVSLDETPQARSAKAIKLRGGEKVDIIDNSMKQWVQVRLPDGRSGWAARADIALI